jgi:hypothetical protein
MENQEQAQEVPVELTNEACQRYPGYPITLAVAKLLADKHILSDNFGLAKGMFWGELHMETIGELVSQLAEQMYHEGKATLSLKMGPENPESDYDHFWLEIIDVE